MPAIPLTRLTLVVVGILLCSLPLTGASLVREMVTHDGAADLRLAARTCGSFGPRDVLRGSAGRNGRTCRPVGLDAEIIRAPIRKATKRDRHNYLRRGVHGMRRHLGTDYRARCRAGVHAAHDGKAIVIKRRGKSRMVGVSTGPGRLTTWYAHLGTVTVRNGAMVNGGRTIGTVGRSGGRCYLHFSVHLRGGKNQPGRVNPSKWLRKHHGTHVSGLAPGKRRKGVFIAATLNVLGHSHTARGWKHRYYGGSKRRMARSIGLLKSNRVSLVGLQELQPVQRKMFRRMADGWKVFSPRDPQDSIAWRTSRFRLLKAKTFMIPYFRTWRPMPVVVLRDRATGRKLVVISVHNPADRHHLRKMHKRRAEAVRRELKTVTKMRRRTHAPVILMGDFNDKSRQLFCRVTKHGLKASSRGIRGRGCRPSEVAGIDWIFGTKGIRFTGHQRVQGGLVERTTDHPLVLARVRR